MDRIAGGGVGELKIQVGFRPEAMSGTALGDPGGGEAFERFPGVSHAGSPIRSSIGRILR